MDMTRFVRFFTGVSFSLFFSCVLLSAQERDYKFAYWGHPDQMVLAQAQFMFDQVDKALDACPPVPERSGVEPEGKDASRLLLRRSTLLNLDAVIHQFARPDTLSSLLGFMDSRIGKVAADLRRPMKKGMKVYKLYNASFIFRTRSVTIAFDINTRNGTLSSPSAIKPVVDGCDALFISHNHSDHFDNKVVDLFLDSGKQVFAPEGYRPDDSRITHIRHDGCYRFTAVLGGKEVPVTVFPGHQDDLQNNVYVVHLPGGFKVAHLGDQTWEPSELEWISKVKDEEPGIDVMTLNGWTKEADAFVRGFSPRLVVSSHENELAHSVDHREGYWMTIHRFGNLYRLPVPFVVMAWGESYSVR